MFNIMGGMEWDIMNKLGKLNCFHFIELNKDEAPAKLKF